MQSNYTEFKFGDILFLHLTNISQVGPQLMAKLFLKRFNIAAFSKLDSNSYPSDLIALGFLNNFFDSVKWIRLHF